MPIELAIGVDMERVSRFPVSKGENERFLKSFMTVSEIEYCFGKGDPQKHIAVRFAVKEAVIKALNRLSIRDISFLFFGRAENMQKNQSPRRRLPSLRHLNS